MTDKSKSVAIVIVLAVVLYAGLAVFVSPKFSLGILALSLVGGGLGQLIGTRIKRSRGE